MTRGTRESSGLVQSPMMNSNSQSAHADGGSTVRSCAGCGARIYERFLLHAVDRYWHTGCLKCSCCQSTLGDFNSCFVKSGMIFCRNDYFRLFGSGGSCGSCGQTISAGELVMKAGQAVYHVKCFTCATCRHQLVTGDRYSVVNGAILCEQDSTKCAKEQ
ncbi:LIM domain transcription factor LMO4-B-like [Mya arenaria]|uniref:LIM domain transcription factor LMO4-B-like n=1 Tax=Mya arenaria TaxID=6604 RepID=UPI0022E2EAE7|nr:LIM domain transcription factor LMO4-B-like [Mya arenaria]XP_052790848.1 LIM domain transcription factor LMO4-B-like [Mya arenaria]